MNDPLTPEEVRVLAVLVEKERSTPDYYPMTLNALTQGCNQKTNREPVVAYDDQTVLTALDGLFRKHRVGRAMGNRAEKYRHTLVETLGLTDEECAVLASLMLRGPQTVGALRSHCVRMYSFEQLDDVEAVLTALSQREPPLVTALPLEPGRKEVRYAHLFSGPPLVDPERPAAAPSGDVAALEAEVAALRERLEDLEAAFLTFRAEFE